MMKYARQRRDFVSWNYIECDLLTWKTWFAWTAVMAKEAHKHDKYYRQWWKWACSRLPSPLAWDVPALLVSPPIPNTDDYGRVMQCVSVPFHVPSLEWLKEWVAEWEKQKHYVFASVRCEKWIRDNLVGLAVGVSRIDKYPRTETIKYPKAHFLSCWKDKDGKEHYVSILAPMSPNNAGNEWDKVVTHTASYQKGQDVSSARGENRAIHPLYQAEPSELNDLGKDATEYETQGTRPTESTTIEYADDKYTDIRTPYKWEKCWRGEITGGWMSHQIVSGGEWIEQKQVWKTFWKPTDKKAKPKPVTRLPLTYRMGDDFASNLPPFRTSRSEWSGKGTDFKSMLVPMLPSDIKKDTKPENSNSVLGCKCTVCRLYPSD